MRVTNWRTACGLLSATLLVTLIPCIAAAQPLGTTVQTFDGGNATPYTVSHAGSNPAVPTVMSGGPSGNFLRLATSTPTNLNTIAFAVTSAAANQIVADFDFRITPPAGGRTATADGLGFALLNTANSGTTDAVYTTIPEFARFLGALGVGFHVYGANAVSVAFNGNTLTTVDVSSVVDLASGQFTHAQITMRPGSGSDVTIRLTPSGGPTTTVVNSLVVPGFTPYVGRAWFGARSGGLSADFDLDNVNVQFSGAPAVLPFITLLRSGVMRFVS